MKPLFLVGYMGCGKSTLGRKLARRLGVPFADTDALVERREGASVADVFRYEGEACFRRIEREVLEETGLRVKNLRYYKSQPWSFSDTLLAGFYCDLDGSDAIRIEEDELSEALWLPRGEIPPRGNDVSLTAEMMERFRLGQDGLPV